jgi:hypothetical protein
MAAKPVKLIDSLERFSEDNMRCVICLDDLRVQRGFLELPCCNGGKLCMGCTYEYITKRKERKSPCCRTDISGIQKWVTVMNTAHVSYIKSVYMQRYESHLTAAEIERRENLTIELNSIDEAGRERYEAAEAERRAREQRENMERIARYERERQEQIERERLERIRVEQERIRLEQERLARERAEEERRQMELARQLSTVQHQIETAGGITGLVSQVRQGIPYQDFYKTVRRNAPHRLQEALTSLESRIGALIRRSTPLADVEVANLKKMQKWHFVMGKNPLQTPGLDEIWSIVWDSQQELNNRELLPANLERMGDAMARPSSLTTDMDPTYVINYDCLNTVTFTNRVTNEVIQTPITANVQPSTGLYPIAFNVVKNTNPARGTEQNTYLAVTYGSPRSDRKYAITLYDYSVGDPLFHGHPVTIDITHVNTQEVPLVTPMNPRTFTRLSVDYVHTPHPMHTYQYVYDS